MALGRLGEPQRALAVQRHRGQRGDRRPGGRSVDPAAVVVGAPRRRRVGAGGRGGGRRVETRPGGAFAGDAAARGVAAIRKVARTVTWIAGRRLISGASLATWPTR